MRWLVGKLGRWAAVLLTLPAGLALAALAIAEPQPVKSFRDIVFDNFQRAAPRAFSADMPARIIDIDDQSLEKLGQWPWPRTTIARLVDAMGALEPLVIAMDIVFSEPDRTSPERVIAVLPDMPERDALERRLLAMGMNNDRVLADAFARSTVISGMALVEGGKPPKITAGFATAGDDPLPFLPKFTGAIAPIDVLIPGLKGLGALNWVPEYDLVVRRVPTVLAVNGKLVPSLGVEALRVAQNAGSVIVKASNASGEQAYGAQTGIVSVKVGEVVIATDSDGAVRVRYAGTKPERRIPAWKIVAGEVPKEEIEGRFLFVGSSASALADLRASPLDPVIPGVEVHAEFIEHALAGVRLSRPDWARGAEAIAVILATLIASMTAYRLLPATAAFASITVVGGLGYLSWYLFRHHDMLIDMLLPGLAGGLAFATTSVVRWRASDVERKQVRAAFSRYLAPAMVERLAVNPDRLQLGGERRDLTILFSDVRGFTSLSETYKSDPQGLTALMNRLLTPLSNAIIEREGTIDKYMGDAIMAFWNAPLDVAEHQAKACDAALDMRVRLNALNVDMEAAAQAAGRVHRPIDVGIGLNTGTCIVGNMGSTIRFDYSVLGDAVNLSSRLEGQTKYYGVNIILGQSTAAAVKDSHALIELDLIRVKGKSEPERIFALLGNAHLRQQPHFVLLASEVETLLEHYRAGDWDRAERAITALRRVAWEFEITGYVEMMQARIAQFRASPPPAGWGGVYTSETK